MPRSSLSDVLREETYFLFSCLFLAFWRFEQGNIFAFSMLVPYFLTFWGRKHICLFHAHSSLSDALSKETYFPFSYLFLAFWRFEEGNIFAFFMLVPSFVTFWGRKYICLFHACSLLSDILRKETYLPFSCLFLTFWRFEEGNIFAFFMLVPYFLTFWGRKHICLFHACSSLSDTEQGNIFPFFMLLKGAFFTSSILFLKPFQDELTSMQSWKENKWRIQWRVNVHSLQPWSILAFYYIRNMASKGSKL